MVYYNVDICKVFPYGILAGYPTLDGGTLKTQTANGSKARVSADEGPPPDDLKAMSSAVNEANPSGTPEEIGKTPYPSLEAQLQSHSST